MFYDVFFYYSFPKLWSANNLHFFFLHGTPMSIFKLHHHSPIQDLALEVLQLKQYYLFTSAVSQVTFIFLLLCWTSPSPAASNAIHWMHCDGLLSQWSYFQINRSFSVFLPNVATSSLFHPQPPFSTIVHTPALSPHDLSSSSSFYPLPLFKPMVFL